MHGKFVVKIIVKQGDPKEFYGIEFFGIKGYVRNDGENRVLSAEETKNEIIRRNQNQDDIVSPSFFNDPEPEALNYIEERQMVNDRNGAGQRFRNY